MLAASTAVFADDAAKPNGARPPAAAPSAEQQKPALSPLDRLKARSAQERWHELNKAFPKGDSSRGNHGEGERKPGIPVIRSSSNVVKSIPDSAADAAPDQNAAPGIQPIPAPDAFPLPPETQALAAVQDPPVPYSEPVRSPAQLKKLSSILPYYDYEPDEEVLKKDRCLNLCPRPGGGFCPECMVRADPTMPGGETACPECPEEVSLRGMPFVPRVFPHADFSWEPSNLYHYPLYFEDFTLERYGQTRNFALQPIVSTIKFSTQLLGLPYQISIDPIWCRRYSLGWYRPGNPTPCWYYQVPWNARAAAAMAGVYTGGAFLFR